MLYIQYMQFMVIKKFSSKLVRLKLTIKRKIELHHRNNIVYPLQMQNSHPVKHLLMLTSKTLLAMGAGGFTTQSYIQDSIFHKTTQQLNFNCLRKNLHQTPDWVLEAPHSNFTNVDIASYNLYKISCLESRVILRQLQFRCSEHTCRILVAMQLSNQTKILRCHFDTKEIITPQKSMH